MGFNAFVNMHFPSRSQAAMQGMTEYNDNMEVSIFELDPEGPAPPGNESPLLLLCECLHRSSSGCSMCVWPVNLVDFHKERASCPCLASKLMQAKFVNISLSARLKCILHNLLSRHAIPLFLIPLNFACWDAQTCILVPALYSVLVKNGRLNYLDFPVSVGFIHLSSLSEAYCVPPQLLGRINYAC